MRAISSAFIGYFFELESSLTFSFTSIALASILIAELALRKQFLEGRSSVLLESSLLEKYSISLRETAACLECYEQHKADRLLSATTVPLRNELPHVSSLGKRHMSYRDMQYIGEIENGESKSHPATEASESFI